MTISTVKMCHRRTGVLILWCDQSIFTGQQFRSTVQLQMSTFTARRYDATHTRLISQRTPYDLLKPISKQWKLNFLSCTRIAHRILFGTCKGCSVRLSNSNRSPDRPDRFHIALVWHLNWSTCQFAGQPFQPPNTIDSMVPATRRCWPFFVIP